MSNRPQTHSEMAGFERETRAYVARLNAAIQQIARLRSHAAIRAEFGRRIRDVMGALYMERYRAGEYIKEIEGGSRYGYGYGYGLRGAVGGRAL